MCTLRATIEPTDDAAWPSGKNYLTHPAGYISARKQEPRESRRTGERWSGARTVSVYSQSGYSARNPKQRMLVRSQTLRTLLRSFACSPTSGSSHFLFARLSSEWFLANNCSGRIRRGFALSEPPVHRWKRLRTKAESHEENAPNRLLPVDRTRLIRF